MSDRAVELARASRYDEIAGAIEGDPEWFTDTRIDDGEIIDGLRLAAVYLRGGEHSDAPEPTGACFEDLGSALVTKQRDDLRSAIQDACDLLAERSYGSDARSPGHNARLRLESALVGLLVGD